MTRRGDRRPLRGGIPTDREKTPAVIARRMIEYGWRTIACTPLSASNRDGTSASAAPLSEAAATVHAPEQPDSGRIRPAGPPVRYPRDRGSTCSTAA